MRAGLLQLQLTPLHLLERGGDEVAGVRWVAAQRPG
jgi:hypothetical protein